MKKYMLASLVLLMVGGEVSAQVYDTIHRRSPNYYYTEWYDEDSVFYVPYPPYRPGTTFTIRMCFYDVAGVGNLYQGIDHYTPRPLEVKGLSCMVAQQYITGCHTDRYFYERDTGNFPEHMYIYQRDSVTDSLVMLDSVRWDTAAPMILELPRNYDTSNGSEYCYVYAKIPATDGGKQTKTIGFLAHMDTSPEVSDEGVRARIVKNYDGGDIVLNEDGPIVLRLADFPEMAAYAGKSLIVTDGTTLLGADDKAGVAEIMTMAAHLLAHPEISHGPIAIAFTPDEEVGAGVDNIDLDAFGAHYAYTVDGGVLGELEYECFNAAQATIAIRGRSVHPGTAKDRMINASRVVMELDDMIGADERPETTEKYEGFYHLTRMEGETDRASVTYIIRDHDRALFEEKKERMAGMVAEINRRYGEGTATLTVKDQYYNMKEIIEDGNYFLVENAINAMEKLGITPIVQPIRGGTDGARLSFMGVPCPNLCTGGGNFHSRFEFACIESMEKITELLLALATQ